ncbi:MAG: chorismate synthase [Bacteroidales bacterium]|nr:chorismate synthase [Bacteroidales bacterium]
MNTFGNIFRLTTAGESHGPALTGIIDGMPAGVLVDIESIDRFMARRAPGRQPGITSQRKEADHVRILSGVFEGMTLGTPIGFTIDNTDCRPADYEHLRHTFRPSHADYTYTAKYGVRDHRGGGRASARETATRLVAGAFALAALHQLGISVWAFSSQIGNVKINRPLDELDISESIYETSMYCPDAETNRRMESLVRRTHEAGDTVGGIVTCVIQGLPAGIGEPVFGKFQSMLASAIMSINAVKGFDYGMGFDGVSRFGSEMNDPFAIDTNGRITTVTNHSGGIQGGITNGRAVVFRAAFKPIATLMREIRTIDDRGNTVVLPARGRHDVCALPRAVPVVHSMAAIATLDAVLMHRCSHI